jgi:2-(3-amino-3-carboxypropyl)histidine synthase
MVQEFTYDLELDRIVNTIKTKEYRKVCIQLPDGLKPHAKEMNDRIRQETKARVLIWAGSNFGACDLPIEVKRLGVDCLIPFGHSEWVYDMERVR